MDAFNQGSGGGGGCYGGGCEMNDDGVCEVCAMWKEIANYKHKGDGANQYRDGSRDSLRTLIPKPEPEPVKLHAPIPEPEPESVKLQAPDGRKCAEQVLPDPYTTLPGCHLTKAQEAKVLEIAHAKKTEIPLHVAAMSLKDSSVYIPLKLVLNHFIEEEITKAIIQLEAPDNVIYSVGASKHTDDLVVIDSAWNGFVASLRIQENDLLVFRSKAKTRLEVLIIDPSGREKTYPCAVMGNPSSGAQGLCDDDSPHFVDPPPCAVIDLSSCDDDEMVNEDTRKSCRARKRVTRSCAKTQKTTSTSSPCTRSGHGGRKAPHDRASVKLEASDNLGRPSQRPFILGPRTTLPLQMRNQVEEKVQAIGSEHPIYVNVMTRGAVDVSTSGCEMGFCQDYVFACLPDETLPLFLKVEGKKKVWHTTLTVRADNRRRVRNGWKEFVRENGLKEGDVCLFELTSRDAGSLTMTVHIAR